MIGAVARLAAASLWARRTTALLTMLAVAVSVALYAGVERIRVAARAGFEATIAGTDLVIGARSGPLPLVLYSVFRLGEPTANVTWRSYQEVAARPEVAWTVPLSLGDSYRGFRVVGTSAAYFEHYRTGGQQGGRPLAFREGRPFEGLFDAVLGSEVARRLGHRLGDRITLTHGLASFRDDHADHPFTIVGVLAPTGTPVDRSVHVSLEAITAIHIGWQGGVPTPVARRATPASLSTLDLTPRDITAFLVGLERRQDVLSLQRAVNGYRGEALTAAIPGVALSQLWQVTSVVEGALSVVAACVIAAGLVGLLTTILTGLNERRREMAVLRAVGAPPVAIFLLLVAEAALLALLGAALGLLALEAAVWGLAPWAEARFGLPLAAGAGAGAGLVVLAVVTGAAALVGIWPALAATRRALADGLAVRV